MKNTKFWERKVRKVRASLGEQVYRLANWFAGERLGGIKISARVTVRRAALKPEEIEVKGADAYASDWLGRAEFGERLKTLISYGSGTGVVLIDGGWGNGKTTFMRMWAHDMRQRGHIVAEVNAWSGDYSGQPLDDIIKQLQEEIGRQKAWGRMGRWAFAVRRWLKGNITLGGTVAAAIADGGASLAVRGVLRELASGLKKAKGEGASNHKRISGLRRKVRKVAFKLWETGKGKTRLVVTIDELDRCRPDYAVRFMEIVKHVFGVEHVTFVIAANTEELAKAVKGSYGDAFDGSGYLERFFDITLELPVGTREGFVTRTVEEAGLESALGKKVETVDGAETPTATTVLIYMLYHSDLSLRQIKKAAKHITIALLLNRQRLERCAVTAIVLCALRFIAKEAYDELDRGNAGYSTAWRTLCTKLGKDWTTTDPVLEMIGDILYWCGENAEEELTNGQRLRRQVPAKVKTVNPNKEVEDAKRRSERKALVSYRVAREAIELLKNDGKAGPIEEEA